MIDLKLLTLVGAALVLGACASNGLSSAPAATTASAATAGATPANDEGHNLAEGKDPTRAGADDNEIVCKTSTVTNSRLKKQRICHTRRVWRDLENQARRGMENMQNRKGGANSPDGR